MISNIINAMLLAAKAQRYGSRLAGRSIASGTRGEGATQGARHTANVLHLWRVGGVRCASEEESAAGERLAELNVPACA